LVSFARKMYKTHKVLLISGSNIGKKTNATHNY